MKIHSDTRNHLRRALLPWAVLLMATAATAQSRIDTVVPVNGSAIRGSVTAATRDEITIDVKGKTQKLPVNELQRIIFGDGPTGLRQAHEALADGQYANALETLNKIRDSQLKEPLVQQDFEFQVAYCKAMLGEEVEGSTAAAAKELLDFLRKYPDSFHFYRAAETLGDLAMRLGSFDKAVSFYGQLAKSPWVDYKLKAAVLEANALQAQGPEKYAEALARYDVVVKAKVRGAQAERQRQFALAGKAACEAELGNTESALKVAEQVIRDNDPSDVELFAKAYNALGAAYRQANNPRDAILAYLHVDLLCHRARDAHAESLYYLSTLWGKVGKPDRAAEARSTLKARYAGTTWATR
jgi:tetratricopeptide (TPR) repeat protein